MRLHVLEEPLAVVRLQPETPVPQWVFQSRFFSVTKTDDELSIFCEERVVPSEVEGTGGWRAFRVAGQIAFELSGVISGLTLPLAAKQISLFSISTHDTDYLVVREDRLEDAIDVLQRTGHQFV